MSKQDLTTYLAPTVHGVAYDAEGTIVRIYSGAEYEVDVNLDPLPWLIVPTLPDPQRDCVRNRKVVPRQAMALTVTGHRIEGIPRRGTVEVEGKTYGPINDGVVEWSSDLPGPHVLTIRAPFHLTETVTLP